MGCISTCWQTPAMTPASPVGQLLLCPADCTSACCLSSNSACSRVCLQGKLPPCPVDPIIAPNLETILKGKPELQRLALVK